MKKTISLLLVLSACLFSLQSFSQQSKIDSLLQVLKAAKDDTNKVNILNDLSKVLMQTKIDTSILLITQALQLAEKIQLKKGMADSHLRLGAFHYMKGDFIPALENYNQCVVFYKELKEKQGEARVLGNIAIIYTNQADYSKALEYYFKALKMHEENGDKEAMRGVLANIGQTYTVLKEYSKALTYSFKVLKMAEEAGDKKVIASNLSNIGNVYRVQKDFPKALEYFFRALKINEEIGNKRFQANDLLGIAVVYSEQGDSATEKGNKIFALTEKHPASLDYAFRSLKKYEESGDKFGIEAAFGLIGSIYRKTGKLKEAEEYLKKAIVISESIGALNHLRQYEEKLSLIYDTTGRCKLALEHYKKAMVIKDTLFNQEKNKEITRKEMTYEFEKKEEATKAEQDKKDAVTQQEIQKQKLQKYSFIGSLGLVIVLMFYGYRTYRTRQALRLQDIRNKIAGDLHDDIGSTLNSISVYSEVARRKDEEQDEALEMIGDASRKIIDAMSDIVWTVNPENDSFAKILFRMKSLAYNLFRAKKIEYTFHADESLDAKKLSLEDRRNFYLIFKEAVNNMVKYSNATQATITLTNENENIRLLIRDNGVGFDTSQDAIGNGLKNMKRRADEMKAQFKIESTEGNGTQIELILKA